MCKNKILFILIFVFSLGLNEVRGHNKNGTILVLSSYNPDIKRMSSFLSEFELTLMSEYPNYDILVEDLNFKGLEESYYWKQKMSIEIEKYKNNDIRAIILLGQESWATFLSIGDKYCNVPFFGCIASENGIYITDDSVEKYPEVVDFKTIARDLGQAGGSLNKYDIKKNIQLIKTLYPNLSNIAFISDNSYGGMAMQALFIAEMKQEKNLSYTLLDAREGIDVIENKVSNLPENSVVLLGTWRMGNKGQYLLYSSLEKMLLMTKKPVFTVSGLGLGDLAIGGAMPVYNNNAEEIAMQIVNFYNGDSTAVKFIDSKSEYRFDSEMLKKYGIRTYQLPVKSVVVDRAEAELLLYKQYIYIGAFVFVILISITIFILFLYIKNKKLKDNLKSREKELIIAKEKAEEADSLKTAFLANMSHEIRTPLNAIIGFSSMICEEDLDCEEKKEYGKIVKSNTDMLLTLINDILDISRLQSTNITFIYEDVELISLMTEVLRTTEHKNIYGVDVCMIKNVDSYVLNIDKKRLSQVLINLMTNAYKFTHSGSITMEFEVQDDRCVFSVADTGIGIPLEKQDKVFERFEKVDEFAQGTGLGLAICKQIVTKFGGEIYVDSNYSEGAKFVFTIVNNHQTEE